MLGKGEETESKEPAVEIIQAVLWSNPDATCVEYIQAIDNTFGSTKSGEDLYLSFKSLFQKPNERLSEFSKNPSVKSLAEMVCQVTQETELGSIS